MVNAGGVDIVATVAGWEFQAVTIPASTICVAPRATVAFVVVLRASAGGSPALEGDVMEFGARTAPSLLLQFPLSKFVLALFW